MALHKDLISGLALILLSAGGGLSVAQLPDPDANELIGTASLPKGALIALAVCGVILIIQGYCRRADKEGTSYNINLKAVAFFAFYVLYMIAMVWVGDFLSSASWIDLPYNGGFVITTILYLLAALPLLGRRKPVEIVAVAVLTTGLLAVVFAGFFNILLP